MVCYAFNQYKILLWGALLFFRLIFQQFNVFFGKTTNLFWGSLADLSTICPSLSNKSPKQLLQLHDPGFWCNRGWPALWQFCGHSISVSLFFFLFALPDSALWVSSRERWVRRETSDVSAIWYIEVSLYWKLMGIPSQARYVAVQKQALQDKNRWEAMCARTIGSLKQVKGNDRETRDWCKQRLYHPPSINVSPQNSVRRLPVKSADFQSNRR